MFKMYYGFLGKEERLAYEYRDTRKDFYWLERLNVDGYHSSIMAVPVMTRPIHCDIYFHEMEDYFDDIETLSRYGPMAVCSPVGNVLYLTSGGLAIFQPKDGKQKVYRDFEYFFFNIFYSSWPENYPAKEISFIQATSENLSEMFDVDMLFKVFETLDAESGEFFELFGNLTGHFESYMKRVHPEEYNKTPHLYRFFDRKWAYFNYVGEYDKEKFERDRPEIKFFLPSDYSHALDKRKNLRMKKTSIFYNDYSALRDVNMPIEDVGFPEASNALKRAGILTLQELLKYDEYELHDKYKLNHITIDGITETLWALNRDKE